VKILKLFMKLFINKQYLNKLKLRIIIIIPSQLFQYLTKSFMMELAKSECQVLIPLHTMKHKDDVPAHKTSHTTSDIFFGTSNFVCAIIITEWGSCRWTFIKVPTHNHTDSINFDYICLHKN